MKSQARLGSPDPLTVVLACDEGYAMPLATALRSLAESNHRSWPLSVYVLTDRFAEPTKRKVEQSLPNGAASLTWVHVDLKRFQAMSTIGHISHITFARLLVSDYLPQSLPRILYLDGDLLVLRDLDAMWRTDLEGRCVGAVRDTWIDKTIHELESDQVPPGIPVVEKYFNAGVMLIDLDRWRKSNIGDSALQYLTEHPGTPFSDQDALNVALDRNWKALGHEWNFQGHISTKIQRMSVKPAIVHFITGAKPWMREHGTPNEGLFENYRRKTRFARTAAEHIADLRKNLLVLRRRITRRVSGLAQLARRTWSAH